METNFLKDFKNPSNYRFETVKCYQCNADDYQFFLKGEEDLTGKEGEFQYVKCNSCNLVYQNPRIAIDQIKEFYDGAPAFAILKHNNACGFAVRERLDRAYQDALAGDPISAFGGVLIANRPIDLTTATAIHSLFCEVVIAPSFDLEALEILKSKKNRIILKQNNTIFPDKIVRSCINGNLIKKRDSSAESID